MRGLENSEKPNFLDVRVHHHMRGLENKEREIIAQKNVHHHMRGLESFRIDYVCLL